MRSHPATRLLLIRHAQPEEWARGRCCGSLDVALSTEGKERANSLGRRLVDAPLDAVYSSPRTRSLATASIVAEPHAIEPIVREEISEVDFGEFEGRTYDEIAASNPELYERWMREPALVRFPGGESFDDLRARVIPEIGRIRREHHAGTVAVVTHGGAIRAVLADALGLAGSAVFRFDLAYAGSTAVEWVENGPIVRYVNAPS